MIEAQTLTELRLDMLEMKLENLEKRVDDIVYGLSKVAAACELSLLRLEKKE